VKVLVLGGDGFLGSHFVDYAVTRGHEVTAFDRFPTGGTRNLEHIRNDIRIFSGEFANRDDVMRALEYQEIAYHFISATNPAASWNDPFVEIDENIRQSVQFFEFAVQQGVPKVVFLSSGGTVYGRQEGLISEDTPQRPFSPYGIGKLAIEHFLNYYREHGHLQTDIYRVGNVFGPRQPMHRPQGVIAVWMNAILRGQEVLVYGDNSTVRDYIYVADVVRLLGHSLASPDTSGIYNVGSGHGVSITELLTLFKRVIGTNFSYRLLPRRDFDNESVILDCNRLLSLCPGFNFSDFEEKLGSTWRCLSRTGGGP